MILDTLEHASIYEPIHPLLPAAFAYLRTFDPDTADGRYDVQGDDLFALVQRYTTSPAQPRQYESHQQYLDVQYLAQGRETIYLAWADRLTVTQTYDADKDAALYTGEDLLPLRLTAGDWTLLYPQDAHKPGCQSEAAEPVTKVVLKLRL